MKYNFVFQIFVRIRTYIIGVFGVNFLLNTQPINTTRKKEDILVFFRLNSSDQLFTGEYNDLPRTNQNGAKE